MKKKKIIWIVVVATVVVVAAVLICNKFWKAEVRGQISDFKLPVMPAADFNRVIEGSLGKGALAWKDVNGDGTFILPDGSVEIKELSGSELDEYVVKSGNFYYFNKDFESIYAPLVEGLRRQKVKNELALTVVEPMVTDIIAKLKGFPGVRAQEISLYRDGIAKLLKVAPIMKLLYQKQIGAGPDDRIVAATNDDRELIDRYEHPWCLSDTSTFCVALPSFKKRASGIIPLDVPCNEANEIGSPFEIVSRDGGGGLVAIPYTQAWHADLEKAAKALNEAAAIFENIPREAKFAKHLKDEAAAFVSREPYPYAQSDISWNDALTSDSLLFIRTGPDEVGGDGVGDNCDSKARFHFNLGIKSGGATAIIDRLRPAVQGFENLFAGLIGNPENYQATEIQVQLPVFLDVVYAVGDDVGGPGGTPIGQTLPNWCGPDGKGECMHGTMIYANKTIKAYSDKLMNEYIMPLFEPELKKYFNAQAGLDSVVYHEIFHNIGPRGKKKRPGSEMTYGDTLVTADGTPWGLPVEELKAQTGSMYMATIFYEGAVKKHEAGELDDAAFEEEVKRYREHITYDIAWALRMILRASRSGPEFASRSPYSRLAAVQVGFLAEQGALKYNKETKQWSIDFEKMPGAIIALTKKMGQLYVNADADQVEKFFLYYMKGDGEKLLHRDRLLEVAGAMPSVLFDYRIKGL